MSLFHIYNEKYGKDWDLIVEVKKLSETPLGFHTNKAILLGTLYQLAVSSYLGHMRTVGSKLLVASGVKQILDSLKSGHWDSRKPNIPDFDEAEDEIDQRRLRATLQRAIGLYNSVETTGRNFVAQLEDPKFLGEFNNQGTTNQQRVRPYYTPIDQLYLLNLFAVHLPDSQAGVDYLKRSSLAPWGPLSANMSLYNTDRFLEAFTLPANIGSLSATYIDPATGKPASTTVARLKSGGDAVLGSYITYRAYIVAGLMQQADKVDVAEALLLRNLYRVLGTPVTRRDAQGRNARDAAGGARSNPAEPGSGDRSHPEGEPICRRLGSGPRLGRGPLPRGQGVQEGPECRQVPRRNQGSHEHRRVVERRARLCHCGVAQAGARRVRPHCHGVHHRDGLDRRARERSGNVRQRVWRPGSGARVEPEARRGRALAERGYLHDGGRRGSRRSSWRRAGHRGTAGRPGGHAPHPAGHVHRNVPEVHRDGQPGGSRVERSRCRGVRILGRGPGPSNQRLPQHDLWVHARRVPGDRNRAGRADRLPAVPRPEQRHSDSGRGDGALQDAHVGSRLPGEGQHPHQGPRGKEYAGPRGGGRDLARVLRALGAKLGERGLRPEPDCVPPARARPPPVRPVLRGRDRAERRRRAGHTARRDLSRHRDPCAVHSGTTRRCS